MTIKRCYFQFIYELSESDATLLFFFIASCFPLAVAISLIYRHNSLLNRKYIIGHNYLLRVVSVWNVRVQEAPNHRAKHIHDSRLFVDEGMKVACLIIRKVILRVTGGFFYQREEKEITQDRKCLTKTRGFSRLYERKKSRHNSQNIVFQIESLVRYSGRKGDWRESFKEQQFCIIKKRCTGCLHRVNSGVITALEPAGIQCLLISKKFFSGSCVYFRCPSFLYYCYSQFLCARFKCGESIGAKHRTFREEDAAKKGGKDFYACERIWFGLSDFYYYPPFDLISFSNVFV